MHVFDLGASAFLSQMQCLHSSCAILSTTATLCWCRTPAAGSWREATSTRSSCCTPWAAGPRMTTCPWTGGWSSTRPCSRRRFWTPGPPSWPSSHRPCCMRAPQRCAAPRAGLGTQEYSIWFYLEEPVSFWDSSSWADSKTFWSLYFIQLNYVSI